MNLQESIRRILREETLKLDMNIICDECGWSWKLSEGGNDPYTCHKCGNENSKKSNENKSIIIEKLLNKTFVREHSDIVCKVEVKHPDERKVLEGQPKYQHYSVTVTFIGGYGTKYWPRTMAVNDKYDYLMEELWETVYNYTNTPCDIYSKYVKECPDETNNISHTELTERCWKGYTQKGMKTMFGKRYPNCIKKKK